MRTNFYDIAFFFFCFNLFNFYLFGVGVYKNQGIINIKKEDKSDIGKIAENLNINTTDRKKTNKINNPDSRQQQKQKTQIQAQQI